MERQMLIVSNLIRNADRAPDHTVIQFRSAFEETYEEWIWITLYNLGFDSQSSFVFQLLSITARDEKQCLLLVHAGYLKQVTHVRGSTERFVQVKFK